MCMPKRVCIICGMAAIYRYVNDQAWVAPGMSVSVKVWFSPDSNGNFSDELTVFTQSSKLIVPLRGRRYLPKLTIPSVINIKSCIVDDLIIKNLNILNNGNDGRFFIMTREKFLELDNLDPEDFPTNYERAGPWGAGEAALPFNISKEQLAEYTEGWGSAAPFEHCDGHRVCIRVYIYMLNNTIHTYIHSLF